jgi:hypothetical protein
MAMATANVSARDFAFFVKGLGFKVYLAKSGGYGFITDDSESRVLSFSFTDGGSLRGNYGPPSHASGTGWRMDQHPCDLQTAEHVRKALYAHPPEFAGRGWKHMTNVAQYLAMYGSSSQYTEL